MEVPTRRTPLSDGEADDEDDDDDDDDAAVVSLAMPRLMIVVCAVYGRALATATRRDASWTDNIRKASRQQADGWEEGRRERMESASTNV